MAIRNVMSKSYVNRYEALGLSPEQVKKLAEIASAYTAAGRPTSVGELIAFAFSPTKADLEKLSKIKLSRQPWLRRGHWWLLDALDSLRRLLANHHLPLGWPGVRRNDNDGRERMTRKEP
jgi:hypothetical protein